MDIDYNWIEKETRNKAKCVNDSSYTYFLKEAEIRYYELLPLVKECEKKGIDLDCVYPKLWGDYITCKKILTRAHRLLTNKETN